MAWKARVRAAGLVVALITVGCSGATPTSPTSVTLDASLSAVTETDHYRFRHAPNEPIDPARQEAFHLWMTARISIDSPSKITYYRYRDRQDIQRLTGRLTNGFAEPESLSVHSVYPWDAHETIHVLSHSIGRPTDFWNEGLAVAYAVSPADGQLEPLWHLRSIHAWAREFLEQRRLPETATVVETESFRRLEETLAYTAAGSFVAYVAQANGLSCVLDQFRNGTRGDSRTVATHRFRTSCGQALEEADDRWRAWLHAR